MSGWLDRLRERVTGRGREAGEADPLSSPVLQAAPPSSAGIARKPGPLGVKVHECYLPTHGDPFDSR